METQTRCFSPNFLDVEHGINSGEEIMMMLMKRKGGVTVEEVQSAPHILCLIFEKWSDNGKCAVNGKNKVLMTRWRWGGGEEAPGAPYPFPGLVFEEGPDDGEHGVDEPRLIHKVNSSKTCRETVLRTERRSRRRSEVTAAFGNTHTHIQSQLTDLQTLDGQFKNVGRQLRRLFEGEVAPVDEEKEAMNLLLWLLYQHLQREQESTQDVYEGVPTEGGRSEEERGTAGEL